MSNVTLKCYSQGVDDLTGKSLEELVAYIARVSNPANQNNTESAERLISYLFRNKHFSPFEMASATLEINTTRDIARQILRHRSFSFQEFSQRYAKATDLGFELREARLQDTKNRQNSIEIDDTQTDLNEEWERKQVEVLKLVMANYDWALENGIAKEQARSVLPEGITKSRLYMAGTLRSWYHYIQLRSANGTQKEHRLIALQCANALAPVFPIIKLGISEQECSLT